MNKTVYADQPARFQHEKNDRNNGNFGIRNGKIPCDINTKFSETERVRENEYTASYAV
jgi:hypothetical protein